MPNYRRAYQDGGTYFFTLVTHARAGFLCDDLARELLHESLAACGRRHPFTIEAMVLLPDHMHALWRMPEGDSDFPMRFSVLKRAFTHQWLKSGGKEGPISASRRRVRRRGVWQRRFWEHLIRDQDDFNHHLNYIHYNPVKHGLCKCPHQWPYSTFGRWAEMGYYEQSWCCTCDGRTAAPDVGGLNDAGVE